MIKQCTLNIGNSPARRGTRKSYRVTPTARREMVSRADSDSGSRWIRTHAAVVKTSDGGRGRGERCEAAAGVPPPHREAD
jgi:hypothetical protein